MTLLDGQSEVDSVEVKISGLNLEIKTWDDYSIREDFLTPTAAFDFVLSTNDPTKYNNIFVEGAEIQISVNGRPQLTGTIEKVDLADDRKSGLAYRISGRDILGPVVSASIDTKVRITSNQYVSDFLSLVLSPFGISKVSVGDENNYSVVTGFLKGQGGRTTSTVQVKEAASRTSSDGKATIVYNTKNVTQVVSRNRPDLKKIPLDQLKPKIGDGAMQVINRLLSRLGLAMWAAADGSGVIVDSPDWDTAPIHRLVRHFDDPRNNVIEGRKSINAEVQPSCLIAVGQSSGSDMAKIKLKAVAVNELVAVNPDGTLAKHVQDTIANYPGIKVLPLRKQLIPSTNRIVSRRKPIPMFLKDEESKSIDQIAAFVRRKLSEKQKQYQTMTYVVTGHAYNGHPWAINTNVEVDDDYLGVHETMWVMSRVFKKSRGAGTITELQLIKPFTLALGED